MRWTWRTALWERGASPSADAARTRRRDRNTQSKLSARGKSSQPAHFTVYVCSYVFWLFSSCLLQNGSTDAAGNSSPEALRWPSPHCQVTWDLPRPGEVHRSAYTLLHKLWCAWLPVEPMGTAALLGPGTGTRQINGDAGGPRGISLSLRALSHKLLCVSSIFHMKRIFKPQLCKHPFCSAE